MVRATVFAEASGSNPAELARHVNQDIAEGLKVIKARPGVSVKSGRQSTFPVYGQNQKIESWRIHSELILESRDAAAVSELLGQLQQMRLAVSGVSQLPTPETRRKVEDEATRDAIAAFRQRAAVVAEVLGKPYKIRHLSIQAERPDAADADHACQPRHGGRCGGAITDGSRRKPGDNDRQRPGRVGRLRSPDLKKDYRPSNSCTATLSPGCTPAQSSGRTTKQLASDIERSTPDP